MKLDLHAYDAATFDCYGTLIDWETGISEALGRLFRRKSPEVDDRALLLERVGLPRERILHVAQSLFHDVAPARRLGFSTVWVNRRGGRPGGITPVGDAVPHLEVPDLATLADLADDGNPIGLPH